MERTLRSMSRIATLERPLFLSGDSPFGRYTGAAIALHWLVAVVVIGQIFFGWYLGDVPRGSADRGMLVNLHKSIGLTIWLLVWLRMGWRWTHPAPPLPASLPEWQRAAAAASHFALYACLFVLPLVGYLGSNFSKHGILLYGALKIPPWGPDDKGLYDLFRSMHTVAAWALVVLVCVHVAAAIHHAVRRDGVMGRMLPGASLR